MVFDGENKNFGYRDLYVDAPSHIRAIMGHSFSEKFGWNPAGSSKHYDVSEQNKDVSRDNSTLDDNISDSVNQ